MDIIFTIIKACISILNFNIVLFGYKVSLMAVAIFVCLGGFLLGFLYKLFR